jgi:hypothetical protein
MNSSLTLIRGLAGNAWEPSNRKYYFRPPTIVVSLTTTVPHFLSLSLFCELVTKDAHSFW